MAEELRGTVETIIFTSHDGDFCIFRMSEYESGSPVTVTGNIRIPYVGEKVLVRGCWVRHPRFGMQLKADVLEQIKPEKTEEIELFLSSGMIAGIGPAMAKKIVSHFGKQTLDIFENHIDLLSEIPGIGKKTLEKIKSSYSGIGALQEIVMFLQSLGIPERFALPMNQMYGENVMRVVREEPYRMIGEISGLNFKFVDKMALSEGIPADHEDRVVHGIYYVLARAGTTGHVCGPANDVYEAVAGLLNLSAEDVSSIAQTAVDTGEIPSVVYDMKRYLYLPYLYEAETEAALRIKDMSEDDREIGNASLAIEKFEREHGFSLEEKQKEAVKESMKSGVMVITGGPGTGKTTLIRAIIGAAEQYGVKVKLMAPTGRAAKRLAISSGRNADTIHKALEASMRNHGHTYFEKNEAEPLEEDLIIVDEASMLDISLFYHLLCALKPEARLILVGDIDQLPPVGPGMPLKDLIQWGNIPVVKLEHIFRQEEGSGIIENAARIRAGRTCVSDVKGEFSVIYTGNDEEAYQTAIHLCQDFDYGNEKNKMSMQVLSPMYKGICGVDHLNRSIQKLMQKEEIGETVKYRPGDKVMQTRNDYEKGVYNGDTGIVWAVTPQKIFVRYPEKEVVYEGQEKMDIRLAYAITVHKSQGSEYDTVIFLLRPSQYIMLQRNLLYTGITRARKKTILITTEPALKRAVENFEINKRYSLFLPLLRNEVS